MKCDTLYSQYYFNFFHQGSNGVTSLVNAITEYSNELSQVINTEATVIVAKENVGTFIKYVCFLSFNGKQ